MIKRTVRYASVALPSPESQATSRPPPAPPEPGARPKPFSALLDRPRPRVAIERGRWLPVRLGCAAFSGAPAGPIAFLGTAVLVFLFLLLCFVQGAARRVDGPTLTSPFLSILLVLASAGAAGLILWSWVGTRVRGLAFELSEHPLRPGCRFRVAIGHERAAEADALQVALVCQEENSKQDSHGDRQYQRHIAARLPLKLDPAQPSESAHVRRTECHVPAEAAPTIALGSHGLDWYFEVRLGRWPCWTVRHAVTVEEARHERGAVHEPPRDVRSRPRLEEGPVALWLDAPENEVERGRPISGGYTIQPLDEKSLRSVEFSVLWYTADPGSTDMGVIHHELREAIEGDDLPLYPGSFRTPPLDGPPAYEGTVLKIRWAARLRLRYTDGEELLKELTFAPLPRAT